MIPPWRGWPAASLKYRGERSHELRIHPSAISLNLVIMQICPKVPLRHGEKTKRNQLAPYPTKCVCVRKGLSA